MKVTICELSDNQQDFKNDWTALCRYILESQTELLLLPELPFFQWIASEKEVSDEIKKACVESHEQWRKEIEALEVQYIIYSAPEIINNKFYNTAFIYEKNKGHHKIHTKAYFPEEPHFWEESWFDREAEISFEHYDTGYFKIGVLLCTELWFTEKARDYGKQGVDLLLCPRATGVSSVEQWISCGKTVAIISGAYCLSSNRKGMGINEFEWGGSGFITEPISGKLLSLSSDKNQFVTHDIDLETSKVAKKEYPQYVKDL